MNQAGANKGNVAPGEDQKLIEKIPELKDCYLHPMYKIVVLGTKGCGKTSLVNTYINGFSTYGDYKSSYLDDRPYLKAICDDKMGKEPKMYYISIQDTPGFGSEEISHSPNYIGEIIANRDVKDQYKEFRKLPFEQKRPIAGFILCFDMTEDNNKSRTAMDSILKQIGKNETDQINPENQRFGAKIRMVGTKSDLLTPEILSKKNKENIAKFQESHKKFIDTSAVKNENIVEVFEELTREINTDTQIATYESKNIELLADENKKKDADENSADRDDEGGKPPVPKGFCAMWRKGVPPEDDDENKYLKEEGLVHDKLEEYPDIPDPNKKDPKGKGSKGTTGSDSQSEKDKKCTVF